MSRAGKITNLIAVAISVGLGATAIIIFGSLAVPSYLRYQENRSRVLTIPDAVIKSNRDSVFRTLCPDYAEASTWERWTNGYYRDISWCEDYLDRL